MPFVDPPVRGINSKALDRPDIDHLRLRARRSTAAESKSATFTSPISTGTSTSGPITAANAAPELMPNTATATAIASSKLFEAAVKASVAVFE